MIISHKIKLDLVRRELPAYIDVMQDDQYSRQLEITMLEDGRPFELPKDCGVMVRYRKADHIGGAYDTLPDGTPAGCVSGSKVTVALAPQVCTTAGTVDMVITLLSGKAALTSFTLHLKVHRLPSGVKPSREYVRITNFLPQTEGAAVGQYLKVTEVDQFGRVTGLESDAVSNSGEVPENVVTCDLEGSVGDESVVPVNADTLGGELPGVFARAEVTNAFCRAKFPADASLTTTDTVWPMEIALQMGDFWAIEDGALVCTKSHVAEVALQVLMQTGFIAGDRVWVVAYLNEDMLLRTQYCVPNNTLYSTTASAPYTAVFSVGDKLTVRVKNVTAARGVLKNYSNCSFLNTRIIASVEESEEVSA